MINNYCKKFLSRKINFNSRYVLYSHLEKSSKFPEELRKTREKLNDEVVKLFIKSRVSEEYYSDYLKAKRIGKTACNANYGDNRVYISIKKSKLDNEALLNRDLSGIPFLRLERGKTEFIYLDKVREDCKELANYVLFLIKEIENLIEKSKKFIKYEWADVMGSEFANNNCTEDTFIDGYSYGDLLAKNKEWFDYLIKYNKFSDSVLYGANKIIEEDKIRQVLVELQYELNKDLGD